jgi:hypothetical protein
MAEEKVYDNTVLDEEELSWGDWFSSLGKGPIEPPNVKGALPPGYSYEDWETSMTGEATNQTLMDLMLPAFGLSGMLMKGRKGLQLVPKKAWDRIFGPKLANIFKEAKTVEGKTLIDKITKKNVENIAKISRDKPPLTGQETMSGPDRGWLNREGVGWQKKLPEINKVPEAAKVLPRGKDGFGAKDAIIMGLIASLGTRLTDAGKNFGTETPDWAYDLIEKLIPDPDIEYSGGWHPDLKKDISVLQGPSINHNGKRNFFGGETPLTPEDELLHDYPNFSDDLIKSMLNNQSYKDIIHNERIRRIGPPK